MALTLVENGEYSDQAHDSYSLVSPASGGTDAANATASHGLCGDDVF